MTNNEPERAALHTRLGGFAPTQFSLASRISVPSIAHAMRAERCGLIDERGQLVRAYVTGPAGAWDGLPAVVYIHAHGNRYDIGASEILSGRPALLTPPYGEALANAGIVAFAIDLPCFGERGDETEQRAAKRHLWHGRTLFGAMLADLQGAITLLAGLDGIDSGRIGAMGLSMGATLAFWLGAIDPRVVAVAHLCCFCDLETLVQSDAHDLHGIYMTVPGLLGHMRTGDIAGLIAPRPQLACIGLTDPLTPPHAVERGLQDLRRAYAVRQASALLETVVSADTGHVETPAMRAAVMDFLGRRL